MAKPRYSLNGARPAPLPERVTLANGETRTALHQYVDEQLAAWGLERAPDPPTIARGQKLDWVDGAWVVSAPGADPAAVNTERERRIQKGVTVSLTGLAETVRILGTEKDQHLLHGRATVAMALKGAGDTTTMPFRDADNVIHMLSLDQMIELFLKGATWVTAVYAASWALKDARNPIPWDFYKDSHGWPSDVI